MQAYGGYGERVERTEDFAAAFERALDAGVPAVLHLVVDPEAITPRQTITADSRGGQEPLTLGRGIAVPRSGEDDESDAACLSQRF